MAGASPLAVALAAKGGKGGKSKPTPKPDPKMRPPTLPRKPGGAGEITVDEKGTPVPGSLIPVVGKPGSRAPGKPGTVPTAGSGDLGEINRVLYPPGTQSNYIPSVVAKALKGAPRRQPTRRRLGAPSRPGAL